VGNDRFYGILQDIHGSESFGDALKLLGDYGAEVVILNGDLVNAQPTLEESQKSLAQIIGKAGESGLEVYVQPGSHESVFAFTTVLDYYCEKYPNLHTTLKEPKVDKGDHSIVFLPGSDSVCGGEFETGMDLPTGLYGRTSDGRIPVKDISEFEDIGGKIPFKGIFYYSNMGDLKTRVDDPKNTVVFCHIPPRFGNLQESIDATEAGHVTGDFSFGEKFAPKGSVIPLPRARELYETGYPIEIRKQNSGNEDLRRVYSEIGIRKAVSGHFHGSGGRANDWNGNHVPEKETVQELFYNPGSLADGKAGLIKVNGSGISYENISVKIILHI
jgi:Icc-related predicted phosphoesterase